MTTYNFPSGVGWTPGGAETAEAPAQASTAFTLTAAAAIVGMRIYTPVATTFDARLYAGGTQVIEKTGNVGTPGGWSTVTFDTPYSGTTGVTYIVAAVWPTGTASYTWVPNKFTDGTNPVSITVGPANSNTVNNAMFDYDTGVPNEPAGTSGAWFGVDAIVDDAPPALAFSGTDPVGVTDSVAVAQSFARTSTDTVGITDSATVILGSILSFTATDSVGITDAGTQQTQTLALTITDTVGVTDSISAVLSGTALSFTATDTVGVTDAFTRAALYSRTFSDTVGLTDSISASVGTVTNLPGNMSVCGVKGHFAYARLDPSDADGVMNLVPVVGLVVTLTPSPTYLTNVTASPKVTIVPEPIVLTSDSEGDLRDVDGNATAFVIASNDPDLSPTGWTYTVSFSGVGAAAFRSFSAAFPGGQTLDLSDLLST